MVRLQLLGGLSVTNGKVANAAGGQRKSLVLLAVIATAPNGGITREKLIGYFWPDADEDRGKNALRQRMFALRRDLGVDNLFVEGTELRLNPDAVSVDLWDFNAAVAAKDHDLAASLYIGPFLDGVYLKDAPEVERWIENQRAAISVLGTQALVSLARTASTSAEFTRAIDAWRRLAALDPASSTFALGLIQSLADAGDPTAAISYYRVHCVLLRDEFDLEPEGEVTAAVDAIRAGTYVRRTPDAESAPIDIVEPRTTNAPTVMPVAETPTLDTPLGDAINSSPRKTMPRRRWRSLVAALAVSVIAVAIAFVRNTDAGVDDTGDKAPATVLVTQFRNETGDSANQYVADAMTTATSHELSREALARVLDSRSLIQGMDTQSPISAARQLDAKRMVSGRLSRHGDSVQVDATITDVATGTVVQTLNPIRAPANDSRALVEPLQRGVAGAVAALEDPYYQATVGPHAQPPTLAAFQEYMKGVALFENDGNSAPHFRRAIEIDSAFHHAALWLIELAPIEERERWMDYLEARRSKLRPMDRARLDFARAWFGMQSRDMPGAFTAARKMVELAPESWAALHAFLTVALDMQRYSDAARLHDRILKLKAVPRGILLQQPLAHALHMSGDYRRELDVWEAAGRALPRDADYCLGRLRALVALERIKGFEERAAECASWPSGDPVTIYVKLAAEVQRHARNEQLLKSLRDSAVSGLRSPRHKQTPAGVKSAILTDVGDYAGAASLAAISRANNERIVPMLLGKVIAAAIFVGDTALAAHFQRQLDVAPNPRPKLISLARVALAKGQHDEALRLLTEFAERGGRVFELLYSDPCWAPLWPRSEWRLLFTPK